jgi:Homeodomain-like domain
MRGPLPSYRPEFSSTFLEQAREIARQRIVKYQLRQRATLVVLLHQQPLLSNLAAAQRVQLHPRSVQRWRRRWAKGDFSLEDELGRGRKADFSPAGSRSGQGGGLRTGRGNPATSESAVPGRRHRTGPSGIGQTDQSEYSVADSGYRCHQAMAV